MLAGVDWHPDWFWFDPLTLVVALTAVGFRLLLFCELEREDFNFTWSASAAAWSSSGGIGTHLVVCWILL